MQGKAVKLNVVEEKDRQMYADSMVVDGVDLGNRRLPTQQKSRRNNGLPKIQSKTE